MEKVEERVLAYQLAKEIDVSDFGEISGGTVHPTLKVTGSSSGADGATDVSVDW